MGIVSCEVANGAIAVLAKGEPVGYIESSGGGWKGYAVVPAKCESHYYAGSKVGWFDSAANAEEAVKQFVDEMPVPPEDY